MEGVPPLLFGGPGIGEEGTYTHAYAPVGGAPPAAYGKRTWPSPLFACFGVEDAGLNCCCAHCCCNAFVWDSAYRYAGIPGTSQVVQGRVIQGILDGAANAAGDGQNPNPYLSVASDVQGAVASFQAAKFREMLHRRLYDAPLTNAILAHLCCGPCATCQEVNAVQQFAREGFQTELRYGELSQCDCWNLRGINADGQRVDVAPLDNGGMYFATTRDGRFANDAAFKGRKILTAMPVTAVPAGQMDRV